MASIVVRYFAVLRERRGCEQEALEVADGSTLGAVYQNLFAGQPEAALRVGYARNRDWSRADDVVSDGDEIAFLPPLGGG